MTGPYGGDGDGGQTYDVEIVAVDSDRDWMLAWGRVLTLGATDSLTVEANVSLTGVLEAQSGTNIERVTMVDSSAGDAGDPDGAALAASTFEVDDGPATEEVADPIDTTNRWVKVLAWNVARGMTSKFTFREGRSTETQVATKAS